MFWLIFNITLNIFKAIFCLKCLISIHYHSILGINIDSLLQEELLKQSLEYGPLGVKLWFTGDSKEAEVGGSCGSSGGQEPNRAPPDSTFQVNIDNI